MLCHAKSSVTLGCLISAKYDFETYGMGLLTVYIWLTLCLGGLQSHDPNHMYNRYFVISLLESFPEIFLSTYCARCPVTLQFPGLLR